MSTVSATRSTSHFFGGAKIQGAAPRAESGAVGATTNVGAMQCQESTAPLHRSLGGACASTTISDGAAPWNANRSGLENASLQEASLQLWFAIAQSGKGPFLYRMAPPDQL